MGNRVAILSTLLLLAMVFISGCGSVSESSAAPALKSHHLFNFPDGMTEEEMVGALREVNRAIANAGHPNAGYRLWKVAGEQAGEYGYLWEGVWPDQATYDVIHENESLSIAWDKAVEGLPLFEDIMNNQVYNRFIEIPTN